VKLVRAATAERTTFWTPDDLLVEHPLEAELMLKDIGIDPEGFSNDQLENELLASDSAELAQIAMQRGDFERGKKVFYQSAAACFACHDPPAGAAAALGPKLADLKTVLTPEELVDSVLRPSKRIDKDFAQVSVVTVDGKILTGVRVSENNDELVLRNLAQTKPIKIPADDIEEVLQSRTSIMPAGLAKQLKTRQDWDDLMKYVIEVRKR
jgi:putative heme-binding domain-containing protein